MFSCRSIVHIVISLTVYAIVSIAIYPGFFLWYFPQPVFAKFEDTILTDHKADVVDKFKVRVLVKKYNSDNSILIPPQEYNFFNSVTK